MAPVDDQPVATVVNAAGFEGRLDMNHPLFESSPLPNELMALWFAVPGIWLGAKALTESLAADRAVRRILQPAAALAAWIVFVQLASMVARSFWIGLPAGTILLSIAGLIFWLRRLGSNTRLSVSDAGSLFSQAMWLSMIFVTAPIAVMALLGHFHDDLLPNGHMSFVAQLQNDYFPPRLLGFPHIPLRYHYGFDLVCAGLTALTRLRVDRAIQLVTVAGWAYCWCLLWVLGERLTGNKRGGLLTATATLLGGGIVVLFAPLALHHYHFANATTLPRSLLGMYSVGDGLRLRTIIVEYFFQHPFSLGFPFAAATLLAVLIPSERGGRLARYVLLGLLLTSLSLTQDVLCVTLGATLAFTEIIVARRWQFAFVLIGVFVAAYACGGVLSTRIPDAPPMGLYPRFWFTESHSLLWASRVILWHALIFVPLLPLSIWGARYVARPMRWPLLLLAGGSLAVPIFVGYAYSADILKFSAVALFAMGILAGTALTALAGRSGRAWRIVFGASLTATVMSAVVAIAGILWAQFSHVETLATYYEGPVQLGQDDRQAVVWLRRHASPDEVVYRKPGVALGYQQSGGLSSTAIALNTSQFGVSPRRAKMQDDLLKDVPSDLADYRAVGIVWFVVAPDDPRIDGNANRWLAAGEIAIKAQFGDLKIYRVADTGSAPDSPGTGLK
jgi:hypothetical protein